MITKELAKQLIEQAEYNCSGEKVEYNIDDIQALSKDGAYLVFASSESCKTSFVCYEEDGTAYFLDDWQGSYPTNEEEIADYNNWVTIDWKESPVIFNGLPPSLIRFVKIIRKNINHVRNNRCNTRLSVCYAPSAQCADGRDKGLGRMGRPGG